MARRRKPPEPPPSATALPEHLRRAAVEDFVTPAFIAERARDSIVNGHPPTPEYLADEEALYLAKRRRDRAVRAWLDEHGLTHSDIAGTHVHTDFADRAAFVAALRSRLGGANSSPFGTPPGRVQPTERKHRHA